MPASALRSNPITADHPPALRLGAGPALPLPVLPVYSGPAARPLKICLLLDDSGSPRTLAGALAEAGHRVTLLDLTDSSPASAARPGIQECRLPELAVPCDGAPHTVRAYRVFEWLRAKSFDLINLPERGGIGFYALLARRQGVAFERTTLAVTLRGPRLWQKEGREFIDEIADLEVDFMERESVARADVVFCPAQNLLHWLTAEGWRLPATCFAQPELAEPGPESVSGEEGARRAWLGWHAQLSHQAPEQPAAPTSSAAPLVSVCLVHHNRPDYLRQALASLEQQDYTRFEVVLVDDGSTLPEAVQLLDELAGPFAARGWQLLRQENRYLGAARNTAARHARGEYLLFMDDDNLAEPHELSTFVRVARRTSCDILTAFINVFEGEHAPAAGQKPTKRCLPLGGAAAAGAVNNCFGDANALIRTSVFRELGGFSEDYGLGHEDWEFFARAVLEGHQLEVVPEPLFWYRVSTSSMLRSTARPANLRRSLRPYLDAVPPALRGLVEYSQGLDVRSHELSAEHAKLFRYTQALEQSHHDLQRTHADMADWTKRLNEHLQLLEGARAELERHCEDVKRWSAHLEKEVAYHQSELAGHREFIKGLTHERDRLEAQINEPMHQSVIRAEQRCRRLPFGDKLAWYIFKK